MKKMIMHGANEMNCYIIDDGKQCYIIDPGFEKNRIREYISEQGLEVLGILLTHAHFDHINALDVYDVPVYVHELEYDTLYDDNLNGYNVFGVTRPYSMDHIEVTKITQDTEIYLGSERVHILHTPGHTIGGVSYTYGNDMFTGDTLFRLAVGRWDLPTSSRQQLSRSVINIIENTDSSTKVHPGHGPSSTIEDERNGNQFYSMFRDGREF